MKITAVLALLATLSGCAAPQANVNNSQQPAPYRHGYAEGCSSGQSAAGNPWKKFAKDVSEYQEAGLYKQGWDDGFNVCKGQYEAIGRAMR